jgi:superfamily II DNA or RNA helicase
MRAQIFVGAGTLCIRPTLSFSDKKEFLTAFTYVLPRFEMTNKHKQFGWNGEICLFRRGQELPVGCLYRAQKLLQKLGHTVELKFAHTVEPKGAIEVDDLELDTFQRDAVRRALKYKYGVIVAPVRAGKTAITAALIRAVGHYPAWVVTDKKDLVLQTQSDISKHLTCDVGIYSEGLYRPGNITVTSYAAMRAAFFDPQKAGRNLKNPFTIKRNEAVKKSWKEARIVILDECHHAATDNFTKLMKNCSAAAYRIGLTATPQHGESPPLLFESKVGCVISRIQYNTLIDKGRLAKPIVILYNMPYAWYSTYLPTYADVVCANLIENTLRNLFIRDIVQKLKEQNKTCFVQVSRIDHGKVLNDLIPESVFVQGSMEGSDRKNIYKELNEKNIHCVIGTVGKEGLNIPSLNAVINAEGSKSTIANKQKMRSLTACAGKSYGLIIDFIDKGRYLLRHSKARRKMYESLSGFKIKVRNVPKTYFPLGGKTRWQQESTQRSQTF